MPIIATVSHSTSPLLPPHPMFEVRNNGGELEYRHVCTHRRHRWHELWLPINYEDLGRMAQRGLVIEWVQVELMAG